MTDTEFSRPSCKFCGLYNPGNVHTCHFMPKRLNQLDRIEAKLNELLSQAVPLRGEESLFAPPQHA